MTQQAYTVAQFLAAHGNLSRTLFYEMLKSGRGPRTFKCGRRTLISAEAAADWRKAMEADTAAGKSFWETDEVPA